MHGPPTVDDGSTLNLTIRQGSAYLFRRTICHARCEERPEDHLELLRCYYNFVRLHRALKFGCDIRTPAMQAGLTPRRLTFREIFSSRIHFLARRNVTFVFFDSTFVGQCGRFTPFYGRVTTLDGGSTTQRPNQRQSIARCPVPEQEQLQ